MSVLDDIRRTILDISNQEHAQRSSYHVAVVRSVSDSGETCDVIIEGAEFTDVRMTAVADGDCDMKVYPKVGSKVLVVDLSNGGMSDLAVTMYSQFEKLELGTAEHTIVNGDILKTELDKLSDRVDTIIRAIRNATPTPQDGGAGLKSTMVATLSTITQKEDFSKIQDDKIKHG